MTTPDAARTGIDTTVPHSARIWNYWLGGKDNYPVDRAAGDEYRKAFPGIEDTARASRAFLDRAIRFLAAEAGIRQFLDVGAGLPTANNTHQIAQRVAPAARVVYVDNDPLVLLHAQALLTSTPEGVTDYVEADLRDPEQVLAGAANTLDLREPVGLNLSGVLGHVADIDEARSIVRRLMAPLAPGSYLKLNDGVSQAPVREALDQAQQSYRDTGAAPYLWRTEDEIASFFQGLELVPPGLVKTWQWRPDPGDQPSAGNGLGAVARKP